MVHSEIYYRLNESIVTDQKFDSWCRELVDLQANYPKIAAAAPFANEFIGFDGSTGFHLCGNDWAAGIANNLVRLHRERVRRV